MSVPSRMSVGRFPEGLHARLRIAYATAWDALVTAHADQATLFVEEFSSRVPVLEALEHYFTVVPVPLPMQEEVRIRTLTHLDLDWIPVPAALPRVTAWMVIRVDRLVEVMRFRRQFHERTRQLARLVGARAAEAVLTTHVGNALGMAQMLKGHLPADEAVAHYLREFGLPLAVGSAVLQRAQAMLAGEELAETYREARTPPVLIEARSSAVEVDDEPAFEADATEEIPISDSRSA